MHAVKAIHSKGIIHRDIKPNNICIGRGKFNPLESEVYLIDFGLAKMYLENDGSHIKF